MKRTSKPWVRFLCAIALIDATLLGGSHAELVADNSGTLLISSAKALSYSSVSTAPAAVTLPEAVSTSPIATESFSTIQCAPILEPALILPVSSVLGPGQNGFVAMLGDETDAFALMEEMTPVPEPSTGCTALSVATTLTWQLARRGCRHRMLSHNA